MEDMDTPQIGRIVKILSGRDTGKFAIIVQVIDDRYVHIADGDKRKFDQPKKKNILHLQMQHDVSQEVVNSMNETGRVTNGKLRFALNRFINDILGAQQKGE
ncbi:KOW domain-containing RNA-binding protein [Longirhabdus pacifica]|uniref:KOW domain-containing RNA-binding protein n=1 Tax=Longirhabdus pacifica TaxID=2305227 RepID=UPI0010088430|nr:KOW domain-containing RNA-binding protein [Longirhabdus pacifica]